MKRWPEILLLILSSGISILWGWQLRVSSPGGFSDFKAVYYASRSVVLGKDPYKPSDFTEVYLKSGNTFPSDPWTNSEIRQAVPVCINLPTALLLLVPLAHLSWKFAAIIWGLIGAGSLILAGLLTLDLAGRKSRGLTLSLVCFFLASAEIVLASGNLAVVVVALCIASVWCVQQGRLDGLAAVTLAIALGFKPHDAGLIWLFFLCWGRRERLVALKALALVLVFGAVSAIWIWRESPQWPVELHSNLKLTSQRGGLNDPGPAAFAGENPNMIIDLQSWVSYFRDDSRFYNGGAFLICGAMLILWLAVTKRARDSRLSWASGLAVLMPMTLLISYHRVYDGKLLLLTIPALGMVWREAPKWRWPVLAMTWAAFLFTSDATLAMFQLLTARFRIGDSGVIGLILNSLLKRPSPVILMAMAVLYLWIYWCEVAQQHSRVEVTPAATNVA